MQNKKRIVIIDDEFQARQSLSIMLKTLCPEVEICGEADSVSRAFEVICQTNPDGILLDITLEDGTGFDLLDRFQNPNFQIIFTTAYDEFALKAFRYHALDYLLKPINSVELVQAIQNIKPDQLIDFKMQFDNLMKTIRTGEIDKITLSTQEGMVFLSVQNILRLESDGNYTTFWMLSGERHLVSRPMRDFEPLLSDANFYKVHQSHMVNLTAIKKILKEDGGFIEMEDGSKVPIARRRKDEFLELMKKKFS